MAKFIFNYEEWLSGHAKRKTMMQKLERSLVPFEIFEAIELVNDKQTRMGDITIGFNTYRYKVSYDYKCIGHDVYDATLTSIDIKDRWTNLLMGYNKFKIVMEDKYIKTIYSDHEDYFQQVIDMFEREDYAALSIHRSSYINNLLARYIILRLLEVHRPGLNLLSCITSKDNKKISVLATNANRTEWIMYAFSKREAIKLAERYDGNCRNLTIIYFFNQDFEKDGNTIGYDSRCTNIISARTWMMSLPMKTIEKRMIEKRMLILIGLLYNEQIDWHFNRIEHIATNPPAKENVKNNKSPLKEKRINKNIVNRGMPCPQKIPRWLLEDALNVLADEPNLHSDIFHFLCAANMVNAYINKCNHNIQFSTKQVNRMFQAKEQIFKCLIRLAEEHNPNVKISISSLPAILVNITIEKHDFQFSFRGITTNIVKRLISSGISTKGHFDGYFLQPIASALYQYSYMLKWNYLNNH